jgi:DNA-binding CsgD family transcriptional regulator
MKKKLSPRAKEVQFYMKQHLTHAQIARVLGLSRPRISYIVKIYQLTYPKHKVYKS